MSCCVFVQYFLLATKVSLKKRCHPLWLQNMFCTETKVRSFLFDIQSITVFGNEAHINQNDRMIDVSRVGLIEWRYLRQAGLKFHIKPSPSNYNSCSIMQKKPTCTIKESKKKNEKKNFPSLLKKSFNKDN